MPEPAGESGKWQRLGRKLETRRSEIDPRYRNLRRFTSERGLDYRLAWDIEHGKRDNYRRATLTAIEVAYKIPLGTIAAFLAGGEVPHAEDPALAEVWAWGKSAGLSEDARSELVELARDLREQGRKESRQA